MFAKFLLGRIRIEDAAKNVLGRTPLDFVARHAVCDHGCASLNTLTDNLQSLANGGEIRSEFYVDPRDPKSGRVVVTTAAGWGETLVSYVKFPMRKKRVRGSDDLPV